MASKPSPGSPRHAAKDQADLFRLLVDAVKDYAIFMLDAEGIVRTWNSGAERLKGYRPAEIIGQHYRVLFLPEDAAAGVPEHELRTAAEKGRYEEHGERRRKDGTTFRAGIVLSAIRDENQVLLGYAKVTRDLTETRRHETRFSESEERFRLLVEGVRDYAIFMLDAEGRVVSWNPGIERIKGYRPEEIIGRHFSVFYTAEDQASGKPARALAQAIREGRFEEEGLRVRKDGSTFEADVVITPLLDPKSGELRGFAKVTRDVTQRKRHEAEMLALTHALEQRVEQRTRELAEVNEELEAFCYSVSHDLRAPLRGMQGFAQALQEDYADRLDEDARDYLARITRGSRRMEALIEDLLEYSRLSRESIVPQPVSLQAVVHDALARVASDVEARGAQVQVAQTLPRVMGHHGTLVRVIANLVSNAAKFVAEGEVPRVRIGSEADGNRVRLWVEDNGIGIKDEHRERIFRVFERLHGTEQYPGTGIGLAIVRKGMERMGGSAGVEAAATRGSRFWIRLDRVD